MKTFLLCIAAFSFVTGSIAQPKNYPDDVKSVDAIIQVLYSVISGDPGQPRDWDRFRNLFKPESRLIPTRKNAIGNS